MSIDREEKTRPMAPYLIGIDLGTSGCKTVAFNLEGEKAVEAFREYPVYHPKPRWAEQCPTEWWSAVVETVRECLTKSGIETNSIVGLSVDSQREAIVPIGKNGAELYNSIIWLDQRTGAQAEKIKQNINEERVLSIAGVGIDPIFSASKILWLKENVPEAFDRASALLCAKDYIVHKLTGEKVTDYSMASRTMLFDIKRREWSEEICSAIGVPIDKLPDAKESSAVVGEISSLASKETLLPKGLPVVNGGGDRPCECLGAGVTLEGLVNIGTGTGSVIEVPLRQPSIDKQGRIDCCCHVIPNAWEYEIIMATTGASLRWFRDVFGKEEKERADRTSISSYDLLVRQAEEIGPGADGLFFYPYLAGVFSRKFDRKARGIYFGISLSHSKAHFVRALLEGVTFQYLESFGLLSDLGIQVRRINMVGGETKSEIWNQMKADILGMTISIPKVEDAAALGAALLAGAGTGQYSDLHKAAQDLVKVRKSYLPNEERHEVYSAIYNQYERIYDSVVNAYSIYSYPE